MSIKKQLRDALTEALKSGEAQRKTTLRMALASIKNAEVEAREDLAEDLVLNLVQKEVKARQETIEAAKQANRPDLIEKAEQEITEIGKVMGALMPKIRGRADGKQANQFVRELLGEE